MNSGKPFTEKIIGEAERAVGHTFRDRALLEAAFTHKSYSSVFGGENNERLEFLGDAVLELIVSEKLYLEDPAAEEGKLTALRQQYVSKTALAGVCKREKLMRFLRFAGTESNLGGKTVESLPEAILGAIYLDGGMAAAQAFVERFITPAHTVNYKSLLQEYVQKRTEETPVYECDEDGDGFVCTVRALGREARGQGGSKQAAEVSAAEKLYRELTA